MMTYRSKYHNTKVTTADGTFDSMKELHRWSELKLMERAGLISGLARQQRFEVIPKQKVNGRTILPCYYIADFCYVKDGKLVVEDCKGMKTDVYKIKKKLMLWVHGIDIKES